MTNKKRKLRFSADFRRQEDADGGRRRRRRPHQLRGVLRRAPELRHRKQAVDAASQVKIGTTFHEKLKQCYLSNLSRLVSIN